MYGKFLGLDFGNDEIKVAVINRSLREDKLESRIGLEEVGR